MLNRLRNQIGTAGLIVAIVALVAALGGGAYAASGGSGAKATSSAKAKQGKRGKPGKPGPAGPAGPQGPAGPTGAGGPAGPKGDTGAQGANGTNGTNGKDGKNGTTGFTETLPSGKTESGSWAFGTTQIDGAPSSGTFPGLLIPISFSIPLESGLDGDHVHYINTVGKEVILEEEDFELKVEEVDQPTPKPCPGTSAAPEAAAGEFCVYESNPPAGLVLASELIGNPGSPLPPLKGLNTGAGPTGALLDAISLEPQLSPSSGWGTWAVTAE